jgi:hypothetical protein
VKNKGIGLIGILLIIVVIMVILLIMGKVGIKDFFLFPFYVLGGCFGFVIGGIVLLLIIAFILWLIFK